jgi:hypothetical protein
MNKITRELARLQLSKAQFELDLIIKRVVR